VINFKLKSGKSEFNKFVIDGRTEEPCLCKFNLDWCRGCVSNVNPYFQNINDISSREINVKEVFKRFDNMLQKEVSSSALSPDVRYSCNFSGKMRRDIINNMMNCLVDYEKFDKVYINKYFRNNIGLLDGKRNGCTYCYAHYKNNSQQIDIKNQWSFSEIRRQLEEVLVEDRVIRLGKSVECLSIWHLTMFSKLLDLCIDHGARVLVPTKMLYYEPSIAERLRWTRSVIGYSIFCDELEPGPCNWGFDTDYRLKCAQKYADASVQVTLKITMDCTQSFDDLDKLGMPIYSIMDFLERNKHVERQLIPLRIHKKQVAEIAAGKSKFELSTGIQNLFRDSVTTTRYVPYHGGAFIPCFIHKDFKEYFGLRICGKTGGTFYCDSCSLKNKYWQINRKKVIQLPVTMNKPKRWQKDWKDKNQLSFMEDLK
jgi:hypothetical protein